MFPDVVNRQKEDERQKETEYERHRGGVKKGEVGKKDEKLLRE